MDRDSEYLTRFCPSTRTITRSGAPGSRLQTHIPAGRRSRTLGQHSVVMRPRRVTGTSRTTPIGWPQTRDRRAAAAHDVRSAGTASPVPKYVSSGVWPRSSRVQEGEIVALLADEPDPTLLVHIGITRSGGLRSFAPCIASMFLPSRVTHRGDLRSAGVSRVIASVLSQKFVRRIG